jgi:hypothetical protein
LLVFHFSNALALDAGGCPRCGLTAADWNDVATIDALIMWCWAVDRHSAGQLGINGLLGNIRGAVGVIGHRFSFG